MRNFTFKGLLLAAMFMVLGSLAIQAADDGLITKQITVKLEKAGTLPDRIGSTKRDKITNLKIIGEINGTDLKLIRDMIGAGHYDGDETAGKLCALDLSEVKIVSGGEAYFRQRYSAYPFYTENDKLGENAFVNCYGLNKLVLPSNIVNIGVRALENCRSLVSLVIPASVTAIEDYAFDGCSSLASLSVPSSITKIGHYAFNGCSSLTSFVIPFGITAIYDNAFSGCSSLACLEIPSSVTEINDYAFKGCCSLGNLSLPSSINRIGNCSFEGCRSLTSLVIPSSVKKLHSYAFRDCSGLTNLSICSSIDFGDSPFSGCSNLKEVNYNINNGLEKYLETEHFSLGIKCSINYFLNDIKVTQLVIPSSVSSLGRGVFLNCRDITSITVNWLIPAKVGDSALKDVDKKKCILYVPQGSCQDYFLADFWGDFKNIVEFDPTGVDKVTTSTNAKEVSRYSVNGQRLSAPTKGLNIVKYSDGSVKKVAVQ